MVMVFLQILGLEFRGLKSALVQCPTLRELVLSLFRMNVVSTVFGFDVFWMARVS